MVGNSGVNLKSNTHNRSIQQIPTISNTKTVTDTPHSTDNTHSTALHCTAPCRHTAGHNTQNTERTHTQATEREKTNHGGCGGSREADLVVKHQHGGKEVSCGEQKPQRDGGGFQAAHGCLSTCGCAEPAAVGVCVVQVSPRI